MVDIKSELISRPNGSFTNLLTRCQHHTSNNEIHSWSSPLCFSLTGRQKSSGSSQDCSRSYTTSNRSTVEWLPSTSVSASTTSPVSVLLCFSPDMQISLSLTSSIPVHHDADEDHEFHNEGFKHEMGVSSRGSGGGSTYLRLGEDGERGSYTHVRHNMGGGHGYSY